MATLTSLVWNAKANAFTDTNGDRVTRWLDEWTTDDVQRIALTEVKGVRAALARWARLNGFRLYQEAGTRNPADERGDTAALVRVKGKHAVKAKRDWRAVMGQAWTVFSRRQRKAPRIHRRIVLKVDRRRVRTSAEHWPTRGNRSAWSESRESARRFLDRRGFALIDGDLNAEHRDAWGLADEVGGKVRGRRPDWCITNQPARVDVTELGKGGSDHAALLFVVSL